MSKTKTELRSEIKKQGKQIRDLLDVIERDEAVRIDLRGQIRILEDASEGFEGSLKDRDHRIYLIGEDCKSRESQRDRFEADYEQAMAKFCAERTRAHRESRNVDAMTALILRVGGL